MTMRERRLKKVFISAHIVSSHGKDFGNELLRQLPKGSQPLWTEENLSTGCLHILIYNPDFEVLDERELVPELTDFDMKVEGESRIIKLN